MRNKQSRLWNTPCGTDSQTWL